jgi:hypothetical protein|nr:hypothetical protein [Fredinandcohnia onubensis]
MRKLNKAKASGGCHDFSKEIFEHKIKDYERHILWQRLCDPHRVGLKNRAQIRQGAFDYAK